MSTKLLPMPTPSPKPFAAATRPLGRPELAFLQSTLADIAPEWSVELHGFCAEEASLVLLPEDGDDAKGPSFIVTREHFGLKVDQVHWEELTEIGVYVSIQDAAAALSARLSLFATLAVPEAVTVH